MHSLGRLSTISDPKVERDSVPQSFVSYSHDNKGQVTGSQGVLLQSHSEASKATLVISLPPQESRDCSRLPWEVFTSAPAPLARTRSWPPLKARDAGKCSRVVCPGRKGEQRLVEHQLSRHDHIFEHSCCVRDCAHRQVSMERRINILDRGELRLSELE